MQAGVPVLWWRAVGSTHTAYAVEAFLDEVAEAAGKDPVALRSNCSRSTAPCGDPEAGGGEGRVGEQHQPRDASARGRRGVFSTVVAQVAEISIPGPGQIKGRNASSAPSTAGTAINPDQVVAQIQGGIGFGLSSILGEEITLTSGRRRPRQLRQLHAASHRADADGRGPHRSVRGGTTGAGEPGVPPIGPALANAVYQATKRSGFGPCRFRRGIRHRRPV